MAGAARIQAASVALVGLVVLSSGCTGADEPSGQPTSSAGAEAEAGGGGWTVLQYHMADTNLEPFMMEDLGEMGDVGSNANVDIVAMVDRSPDYGDDPVLDVGSWTGAKLLHILQAGADELADDGQVDMSDPATLAAFIAEGIERFPSEHYALILNDHGASWPGVGSDESADGDIMDLTELREALATGLADAGVDRLDLIGFDACLMAAFEVANAVAPFADRMVASSELEPGHGYDYHALQVLADDPVATADDLGTAIVDGYLTEDDTESTLALLDLTEVASLDEAMGDLTAALTARVDAVAPEVARTVATNPGYGKSPDPDQDAFMTDLGALVEAIGAEAHDVADEADAVLAALDDVVVHRVSGPDAPDYSGLSIYFPPLSDYLDPSYEDLPAGSGGWSDFLGSYFAAGASIPPTDVPTFTTEEPELTVDSDGLTMTATLDPGSAANLAGASIVYGVENDDGSVTYLGEETAQVADDGSATVSGFYDLTTLEITDGEDTATAYITLSEDDDDGGFTLEVPMEYHPPDPDDGATFEHVVLSIAVDGDGSVLGETYYAYDPESGSYGEMAADPEGLIVPRIPTVDASGETTWSPTTDIGLFADLPNLQYDVVPLDPGTELYVELSATDYGGNTASVSAVVEVP